MWQPPIGRPWRRIRPKSRDRSGRGFSSPTTGAASTASYSAALLPPMPCRCHRRWTCAGIGRIPRAPAAIGTSANSEIRSHGLVLASDGRGIPPPLRIFQVRRKEFGRAPGSERAIRRIGSTCATAIATGYRKRAPGRWICAPPSCAKAATSRPSCSHTAELVEGEIRGDTRLLRLPEALAADSQPARVPAAARFQKPVRRGDPQAHRDGDPPRRGHFRLESRGFRSRRPSPPPFPSVNSIPARCKANRMALEASSETTLRSFSKSTTVDRPKFAARASCDWVMPRSARAARHWAGVMKRSIIFVDNPLSSSYQ